MTNITDQIKEKIDIAEFLKEYIQLTPAGRNFKALCPFHKESNPSFVISPDRQTWYCFGGCNDGGDIFKFLMKFENLEFYEALKILAEKAGVDFRRNPNTAADYKQFGILYDINNSAKDFFRKNFTKESGQYLLSRGLTKDTIMEFEVGFAPPGSDNLLRYLVSLGFTAQDIERAGLVFKTDRGTYWDRFRQRIMFPIFNSFGKTVGFTGRIFETGEVDPKIAKYINSPETPIFNKSRLLYGLHKSKNEIRKQDTALLVEGQMDVLMSYQDGVKNVVASSGTALGNDQLKTLRRLSSQLILSFDSDEAGQLAAERSIDLALAQDFLVSILKVPGEKDPADFIKAQPGIISQLIKESKPVRHFYFNRYLSPQVITSEADRKNNIRHILTKIKGIFSRVEQAVWLKELSNIAGIREEVLYEELEKVVAKKVDSFSRSAEPMPVAQPESWSRRDFLAQRVIDLGGAVPENFKFQFSDQLALKASLENSNLDPEKKEEELAILIRQLKIEDLKDKRQLLQITIAQAEKQGDEESIITALKEFDTLNKEFYNITNGKNS
ncbi:TPA: DNA primase [Patescibacteria group bacterium]|nr:DNA primase [Patescibacteria group bacterium]